MSLIIGLTGGIGSGKTTVANLFEAQGIDIIDADIIARQLVEPNTYALKAITKKFGSSILLANGCLDRAALRKEIFSNANSKNWLENLLHPLIHKKLIEETQKATSAYCLLVAPLLFENKLEKLCQRILVVDVTQETQLSRTCQRDNISTEQAKAILSSQVSRQERLKKADDIVTNNDSIEILDIQVKNLHAKYLSLSKHS